MGHTVQQNERMMEGTTFTREQSSQTSDTNVHPPSLFLQICLSRKREYRVCTGRRIKHVWIHMISPYTTAHSFTYKHADGICALYSYVQIKINIKIRFVLTAVWLELPSSIILFHKFDLHNELACKVYDVDQLYCFIISIYLCTGLQWKLKRKRKKEEDIISDPIVKSHVWARCSSRKYNRQQRKTEWQDF